MAGDLYLQIFFETAWRASIVPFSSESTFYAMLSFGGYHLWLAVVPAAAGALIGHCFNWCTGQIFLYHYRQNKFSIPARWYNRLYKAWHSYLFLLLLLCWMPFVNGLGFIAGFFNMRLRLFALLVTLSEIGHYAYSIVSRT